MNERDSEWGGILQTPLYCLPVLQGRQSNPGTRSGVLPKQAAVMDAVPLQGKAGHRMQNRVVLDLGKHFFPYVGGVQSKFAAGQNYFFFFFPSILLAICEI